MERAFATVTIANAATDSAVTPVPSGFILAGVITPAALTGASVSLKGNVDATSATVLPVYNEGTLYSSNWGTSRFIAFNTVVTKGLNNFSLVSASAEAALRTFTIIYVRE